MQRGKRRRNRQTEKPKQDATGDQPAIPQAESAPKGSEPVDTSALAPYNSYGSPDFVERGYYVDKPFTCVDCGAACVYTAAQQKWWYEVAKGQVYSRAKRCQSCRRARRTKAPNT